METILVIDQMAEIMQENVKLKDTIRFLERELAKARELIAIVNPYPPTDLTIE